MTGRFFEQRFAETRPGERGGCVEFGVGVGVGDCHLIASFIKCWCGMVRCGTVRYCVMRQQESLGEARSSVESGK